MDIVKIGSVALLCVGSITLVLAVWQTIKRAPMKYIIIVLWVFGFALSGVGIYGPRFLDAYSKFLGTVLKIQQNPGADSYGQFFSEVAQGKIPSGYAQLGTSYVLDNPIEGMDSLLAKASSRATDSAGRNVLKSAQAALDSRRKAATAYLVQQRKSEGIGMTSPASRDSIRTWLIARPLITASDSVLTALNLDRAELRKHVKVTGYH